MTRKQVSSWFPWRRRRAPLEDVDFRFLQQSSLFSGVSMEGLQFLHSRVVSRGYSRHVMIFRDDNPGVCMFIVKQGQVELFVDDDDSELVQLALLDTGALFGEIAPTFQYNRTASARASKNDTVLLSVSRFDLEELYRRFPGDGLVIQVGVSRSVIESLITTTNQVRDFRNTIKDLEQRLEQYENR